jgi:ABC-2 type transport system ATP-binding protein
MPVLSVKNLRKVYPNALVAVDGVSFDLEAGEILGLLGSNGAGKTTTIQMLLSTLHPTSGQILYFGKDFFQHRSEVLQHVAFASTYVSLPYNLTVQQNLEVFGGFYGLSRKEVERRTLSLLERFGILPKLKRTVAELSAGQVTRLMLVKAFMTHPKIALLDEPTASLDPDVASEVIRFILEQSKELGTAILYTSHDMAEVAEVCSRVLFMKQGKIIADGLPKTLVRSVLTSKLRLAIVEGMAQAVFVAEALALSYVVTAHHIELSVDETQVARYLSELGSKGVLYTQITLREPTLEDYFLHMVKQT